MSTTTSPEVKDVSTHHKPPGGASVHSAGTSRYGGKIEPRGCSQQSLESWKRDLDHDVSARGLNSPVHNRASQMEWAKFLFPKPIKLVLQASQNFPDRLSQSKLSETFPQWKLRLFSNQNFPMETSSETFVQSKFVLQSLQSFLQSKTLPANQSSCYRHARRW